MAHSDLSKDMVDLVMKIKKHVRGKYDISIALADPELLDKLIKLKNMDDPVLQGMLSYLMALAGPEWSEKFNGEDSTPSGKPEPTAEKKRLFGLYRGKPNSNKEEIARHKSAAEAHDETVYRGHHLGDEEKPQAPEKEEKKPIRYYRGQPIYE